MKYILTIFSILTLALSAGAQNFQGPPPTGGASGITGHISGTVIDSITKKPIDYATVALFATDGASPINGVVTDEKGNFKLNNISSGSYKVTVSFLGYPAKTITPVITSPSKPDKNLGVISLAPSQRTLKEVSVVGQAALIENKIDKIVYNVEKDITASGGTATDVLGKVPMVSVDMNGNVSVRGDQNVRILINGKSTGASAANISDVLRSIPADQIKNIEVITSPSAKYDAEGSAGIINIITKQKNVSGFSGSINGGVGTRQNNGNMNLNYNEGRFHASANLGGFLSWPQTSISDFEQHIQNDSINTTTSTKGTSRVSRHAIFSSISAGYDFNAYNSINTTFRLMHFQFTTDGSSNTVSTLPYSYTSNGKNAFSNFDWNMDYTHKFDENGHELDFSTQWSRGSGVNNYTNMYTGVFSDLQNDINSTNNEYTFQLDYTLPVSKVFKIEAGAKSIIRRINSVSDYYDFDQNSNPIFNGTLSNIYKYNQDVYAGYTVLTFTLPQKWSILAGLRDENTNIHGDPVNESQALQPFSQSYNTFIPSLTLQKGLGGNNTLKLVYSKRISRPSLQFLNPFTNSSAPQSQTVGNPTLNAETTDTYELDYNAFFGSSSLTIGAYYKHTHNLIEGIAAPISVVVNGTEEGGTLTRYQNIGDNNSIGGTFFGSVTPFKIFTITGNVNLYTYKPDPSGTYITDNTQNSTYLMYNGFLRGSLTLPSNFLAEAFGFGGSSRRTIQGTNPAFAMYGIGVRKQLMQKKMSVGLNVVQPFANYKHFNSSISSPGLTQTSTNAIPFRSFGITFSYSFGKMSFSQPKNKGINNDDLKQGDQNQQQQGVGSR
ncbi:TonB-dependent receptor [Mucilaginibacter sp. BT774]|uniref:TonB-dependent receptor domain-containing protein n=1 Tax=Mucilaginibacter sp. BT774 TaxID=3062276 RepID=UPI002675C00F|nr:TonB-dependent receptor [Mucilaginibacter sp. BT774]MDO3628815.1 TonB-dependent receptor [Mucilaginibacter sp. BT774]